MKKKNVFRSALALVLAVSLTACGAPTPPQPTATPDPVEPDSEIVDTPMAEGLEQLRQTMEPSAAIACIINMGYFDGEPLSDGFFAREEIQGYLLEYPFLLQMGFDSYAQNEGGEIYCIVPADPKAKVLVTAWDDLEGKAGPTLYESEDGKPFYVQGNVSDIMPNLSVNITDSFGNKLEEYHPFVSLKDGTLVLPDGDQPVMLDMTNYYKEGDPVTWTFDLYVPNETGTDFQLQRNRVQNLDGQLVLQLLVEQRVIPGTVILNSFTETENGCCVDLSSEFADYLHGLTDGSAFVRLSCVVNSYLSAFGGETVTLTVEDQPLTLDGQVFDAPMGMTVG